MPETTRDGTLFGDMVLGAMAGCIATAPMTLAMYVMHRRPPARNGPRCRPGRLLCSWPPQAGVEDSLDEGERLGLTLLAHFGMGTAAGALYGLLAPRQPLPGPLTGAAVNAATVEVAISNADYASGAANKGSPLASVFILAAQGSVSTKQFICKSDPAGGQAAAYGTSLDGVSAAADKMTSECK